MKPGDLLWQQRSPGGVCLCLGEVNIKTSSLGWATLDAPVLRLLHPAEGLIEDPSYYYAHLDAACKRAGIMV